MTGSIVGSGSDMPIDMLMRKQEVTCMYEDPHAVENYHRATLKDMRPLERLWESDQPRGGTDEKGTPNGNNISERFLSFRDSGFQSAQGSEPYLPDGTFLDHQFLEQDPRGVALGPDMRKHADQQFARSKLINFKNDDDNSVPSAGVDPWSMNKNIRSIQNYTKGYFKNFDTSRDSWSTAGSKKQFATSRIPAVEQSGDIRDPSQMLNRNVMNITNTLSNDTSIGFRRTTDHEFKIAKYGKTNIGSTYTNEDWYKNRSNTHIDHDVMVSWQDVNVSKTAALKMIDLSKQKFDAHFTGLHGIKWDESKSSRGTKQKLASNDMAGMEKRPTSETQPAAPHAEIDGAVAPKSGERLLKHDDQVILKSRIDTTIFEKMGLVNKKQTEQQKSDLRDAIEETAKKDNLYMTEKNKKQKIQSKDAGKNLWDSLAIYKKGNSKTIMNYKAAAKGVSGHNLQKLGKVNFEHDSRRSDQRRGRLDTITKSKKGVGKIDNDFGRDDAIAKFTGGMGSKYMTPHIEEDGLRNDVNDR